MLVSAGQSSCDRNSGDWFQKVWYKAPERLASIRLKEIFFLGLGGTVTEKKVQKQDLKNITNVKGCRDGMPKSTQTR